MCFFGKSKKFNFEDIQKLEEVKLYKDEPYDYREIRNESAPSLILKSKAINI
ncbi:hypothetical protein ACFO6R_12405 [Eubacterium multiforme]|uniref:Uncharacterized protein n=1 Tax=Eubacterium multiforme TaxID=83339 RepID=A0ABT9UX87_9FIRM|nr:hypothetical protein [Eubacterium multiforme]MDQ0150925.1 hypothetical protein [Eubacterium multiforme]